ncbi:MAG: hypothetical protein ACK4E0_06470 [Chitinophagaceae bacterium]
MGFSLVHCFYDQWRYLLIFFYRFFNINIFQYIEIGEVILQFINVLAVLAVVVVYNAGYLFLLSRYLRKVNSSYKTIMELPKDSEEYRHAITDLKRRRDRSAKLLPVVFPVSAILIIIIIYDLFQFPFGFFKALIGLSSVGFVFFVFFIDRWWLGRVFGFMFSPQHRLVWANAMLFICLVLVRAVDHIQLVYDNKGRSAKTIYEFNYKAEKVVTNDSLAFLGRTHNYIFLYDRTKKATKVLEREEVTDFVVIEL